MAGIASETIRLNMFRIGVLTSGQSRGSNLEAMAEYFRAQQLPVQICFVIKTVADAPVQNVCERLNLTCLYLPYRKREEFEEKVLQLVSDNDLHLLVLAGFLKRLSPEFLQKIKLPILNIHPALLPKYGGENMYGMKVHEAVFAAKEKESGVSVHLVDTVYDHGPIIFQKKVDISQCKSPEEIAEKVLAVEHQIYGKAIWDFLTRYYT
ncbi:MAG TPA: phosphoribosylglycinamide formyltransferase [Candidatus Cloacimonadota bacterium]|nr:phosphoribosylglycinamide formyltransferase [Candidatus Cloacimonadota bacterium]HQL14306.1 phosphoribosylglycinamide formyltransferase [Candidatus Cloacimonadota bacterium]